MAGDGKEQEPNPHKWRTLAEGGTGGDCFPLIRNEEVGGSTPLVSTIQNPTLTRVCTTGRYF